jgi:hypothetical protein
MGRVTTVDLPQFSVEFPEGGPHSDLILFLGGLGHLTLGGLDPGDQISATRNGIEHGSQKGLIGIVVLDILGEVPQPSGLGAPNLSSIGSQFSGQDTQQAGLTGAVGTDQTNAIALADLEANVVEDGAARKGQMQVLDGEETHGVLV